MTSHISAPNVATSRYVQVSRRNPIVKVVAGGTYSRSGYRDFKAWGYECECGKKAHRSYYGIRMDTRKQALDALHRHRVTDHDGPGWVPDHHGAEPASPSPLQGLAETLAERDDSR